MGNDDVFDDVPFGRGWAWDDIGEPYSAEVGGLQFNDGMATIRVTPRRPGERPLVGVRPSNEHVRLLVLATTAPAGTPDRLEVVRVDSVAAGFIVRGSIPADTPYVDREIAVPDNTLYFLHALRLMLGMSGVPVDGPVVDDDARAESERRPARTLFVHHSPPLSEVLKAFLEPSQNQYGEILLKTLGRELRGAGTSAAGVAAVDSLMRAWGMPPRALYQADGSGLSRYNLVAPDLLVALLEHMARSPRFLLFREALPTGGREGTLEERMRGTPLEGNVTAKTGTLSGVRAPSGYLTTAAGERMVFSMIVNNHTVTSHDADRLAEAALLRLYHLPRAR